MKRYKRFNLSTFVNSMFNPVAGERKTHQPFTGKLCCELSLLQEPERAKAKYEIKHHTHGHGEWLSVLLHVAISISKKDQPSEKQNNHIYIK